ncbi:hypothetical protein EOW65_03580 [Sinirhodobacter ferrireducens]|uniref:Uncharacterized protein n=1 Tax=Paenirhodobacter ferrireducens TaxID=1215032 RepID=A0A443LRY9_9RHOB|nr:phage tail tape measure C-terminal domain-containing protein [Sinirhodobacter ferrireducens]RWR51942.1 hypothetical protein EOW65_03580 [Sinirhodobacter ferrireducens]
MTEQIHSLALKIDAAQAEAGSKRFTAALSAVKKAVQDLDRAADGTFAKLANHKPQFDVTPLRAATTETQKLNTALSATTRAYDKAAADMRRVMLAADASIRQADTSALKLGYRLGDLGDTAGMAKLESALARLKTALAAPADLMAVKTARNDYENVRVAINNAATEAEYAKGSLAQLAREQTEAARSAATHSAALDALRAEFNPLFAASKQYEATLERIAAAERAGVISTQLAARAREQAAATLEGVGRVGTAASKAGYQVQNASYQVGDFFVQVAAGTDATRALAMQLPQLLGGFGVWGAVAGAVAAIMGALVPILLSGGEATRKFDDVVSDLNTTLTTYRDSAAAVNGGTLALREEFGLAAESAQKFHAAMAAVAAMKMEAQLQEGVAALAKTMSGVTDLMAQWDSATYLPEALRPETIYLTADAVSRLQSEFGLTLNQAHALSDAISEAKLAKGPEATSAAMSKVVTLLLAARDAGAKLPPELVKAVEEAATLGLTADRLSAILAPMPSMIGQATGQTNSWASAMSGVRAEISAIMSSLSAIGGGAISNAAKRAELTALQAGQTVRQAEVARLRYENEQRLAAREMGAGSGISGWAQRQLIGMERFQFEEGIRLDDQLNAQREAARKRETSTKGGGGGGGGRSRVEALGDEERALSKLTKSMNDRIVSLDSENAALMLLATGQAKTEESARFMADAMAANGGVLDDTTMAIVRQYEAASVLNEQLTKLARDPVKEWMDSVPDWQSAAKDIQASMTETFATTLADFLKTGEFDATAFADALFAPVFDAVAQNATKELFTALGADNGGLLSGLFSSLGLSSMGDPDLAAMTTGAGQAGSTIAASMVQAGGQVAAQIQAAMTGAGAQAGAAVRSGVQTGGAMAGAQISTAASTGGATLGAGVVQGAAQGAPILASGVASGASGGGILSGIGGWQGLLGMALGAFSEGGVSTSPVGFTTMPASAFRHAPHFSQGTTNTSGIPAVLHPNEAVIPLSKNRKIPVEMGDSAGGGDKIVTQHMTFNIQTPDADGMRRSQKRIAADMAAAGQRAMRTEH